MAFYSIRGNLSIWFKMLLLWGVRNMNSYTNMEKHCCVGNKFHVVLYLTKRKQKTVSVVCWNTRPLLYFFFCSCIVIIFTQDDLCENFNLWIRYWEVKLTWIQQIPPVGISAFNVRDILYAFCNFSPPDCIKVKDLFFSSISIPELTISLWVFNQLTFFYNNQLSFFSHISLHQIQDSMHLRTALKVEVCDWTNL